MHPIRYVVPAAVLALALGALGACGGSDDPTEPAAQSSTTPTETPSDSTSPTAQTPAPTSDAPTSAAPSGGTADKPAALEPSTELLDWRPVPGPVRDVATRSGGWTLAITGNGRGYSLEGPGSSSGSGSGGGSATKVSDTLIDHDWAVVVLQDKAEQRPMVAEVTELATGKSFRVDGRSDVPTTTGGAWALGEGKLLHATVSPNGAYCLASVDLATRASTLGWCAPDRHGFNDARITPAGTSLLTFDLSSHTRASCRTVMSVAGDQATPLADVPDCHGWDGLLTDDGAVWSVVPKETQVDNAHFYARAGDQYYDLGPGTSGSLTWCAGAAYFVRDPQREGDPAALMRWTADAGLAVVYRSPGGRAFLSEPRCGGDAITVTAMAEDRDEQVSALLD